MYGFLETLSKYEVKIKKKRFLKRKMAKISVSMIFENFHNYVLNTNSRTILSLFLEHISYQTKSVPNFNQKKGIVACNRIFL